MATSNNFLSMLFAFFKDGVYETFPLFEDLSAEQIIYIRKLDLPNEENVLTPSYLVAAQDEKNIRYHQYYVGVGSFYPTLASLLADLNALSTANSFTLYTGLKKMDGVPVIGDLNGSIIVNDKFCNTRKYNVNEDATYIYTDIKQGIYYTQIVVDGDQTSAGNYYYDTYLPSL